MADDTNEYNLGLGVAFNGDPTALLAVLTKIEASINGLVSQLNKSGTTGAKFAKNVNDSFQGLSKTIQSFAGNMGKVSKEMENLASKASLSSKAQSDLNKSFTGGKKDLMEQVGGYQKAFASLKGLDAVTRSSILSNLESVESFKALSSSLSKVDKGYQVTRQALVQMYNASEGNVLRFKQMVNALVEVEKAINKQRQAMIEMGATKSEADAWAKSIDRMAASSGMLQDRFYKAGDVVLSAAKSFREYSREVDILTTKHKELLNSQTSYANAAQNIINSTRNGSMTLKEGEAELRNISKQWSNSATEIKKWNAEVDKVSGTSTKVSNAINFLNGDIRKGNTSYKEATAELKNYVNSLKNTGTQASAIDQFMTGFRSKITGVGAATREAATFLTTFGHAIRSMAAWIPAAMLISGITEAVNSSISAIKDYDQALKNLQAISGATEAEIALLGKKILEVSDTTKFSASEIAKGAVYIAQAGFTAAESLAVIEAAAVGAQGTLEPLTTAADLLTTIIRAFKLDARDAGSVMDALAVAANQSKTNLEGMRTVFNYLGPVAKATGASLNETLGAIMALSNAGMKMSTIGTSMRQVFMNLENPNAKFRAAIDKAKLTVEDFNIKIVGFTQVLKNLSVVIGGDLTRAQNFFNVRTANAALIISDMHDYISLLIETTKQFGAAQIMAGIQTEALSVKLDILGNRFKNMLIQFSEGGIVSFFKGIIDAAITVVEFFNGELNNTFTKTTAAVVALTVVVISLGKAFFLLMNLSGVSNALNIMTTALVANTTAANAAAIASGGLAGFVAKLTVVFRTLWAVLLGNPLAAIAVALATTYIAYKNFADGSQKSLEEIKQQPFVLDEAGTAATRLSGKLNQLATDYKEGKDDIISYHSVLSEVQKTFPELSEKMAEANGNYQAQADILKKVSEAKYEEKKAAVEEVIEVNNARVANAEYEAGGRRLAVAQWLMANGFYTIGKAIKGTTTEQSVYANKNQILIESIQETSASVATLRKEHQKEALALVDTENRYQEHTSKLVKYQQDQKEQLLKINEEIEKDTTSNLDVLGESWKAYFEKQTAEGKAFMSKQLGEAVKAGKAAKKATLDSLKASGIEGNEAQEDANRAAEAAQNDHLAKMVTKRIEYFNKIMEILDKEVAYKIKAEKEYMDVSLSQMEIEKNKKINVLQTQKLSEQEILNERTNIEKEYSERSTALVEAEIQREIALVKENAETKKKLINETQVYATDAQKKAGMAALEKQTAEQLITIYKQELTTFKSYLQNKRTELEKYKNEAIAAEEAIAKAKADLSKSLMDYDEMVLDANKLTMNEQEKSAADLQQFEFLIAKGNAEASRVSYAEDKKAREDALNLAREYYSKAKSLAGSYTAYSSGINEEIAKNDEETQRKRIELAGTVKDAELSLGESIIAVNEKIKETAEANYQTTLDSMDALVERINTITSLLQNQISVTLDTTEAANEIQGLAALIGEEHIFSIVFKGQASPETEIKIAVEEVIGYLTRIQEFLSNKEENSFTITFLGNTTGEEKVPLLSALNDVVSQINQLKSTLQSILADFTIRFMGSTGYGIYSFGSAYEQVKLKLTELMELLTLMNPWFLVSFMGDMGTGALSLSSAVNAVWNEMRSLSDKINSLRTVHRIVTEFVSSGGPAIVSEGGPIVEGGGEAMSGELELAEGGQVPGAGDSDSVPAKLTPGEYVVQKSVVSALGAPFFEALNKMRNISVPKLSINMPRPVQHFATGGLVQSASTEKTGVINFNPVIHINGVTDPVQIAKAIVKPMRKELQKLQYLI